MSKPMTSHTIRSKKNSVGSREPSTLLFLGSSDGRHESKTKPKKDFNSLPGMKLTNTSITSPVKRKRNFDNNTYSIMKRTLEKSPKMANYIKEVYDVGSYHS